MIHDQMRKKIETIATRQAQLFFAKNRHLDDDALDSGLFVAIRRTRENYQNHPTLEGIANETMAAICAEVWRLRAEARDRNE